MTRLAAVYWDSCAWLGFINGESAKKRPLETIYTAAAKGHAEIWTSTISFVEVFRLESETHAAKPYPHENLDIIDDAFRQEFVKLVPVDMEIGRLARRLRRDHKKLSKPGDAIHLASALCWPVDCLMTYDSHDLLHLNGKIKSKGGEFLRICPPDDYISGPLFSQNKVQDGQIS